MNSARHAAKKTAAGECGSPGNRFVQKVRQSPQSAPIGRRKRQKNRSRQAIPVPKYDGDQAASQADLELIPSESIQKGLSSGFERQPFRVVRLI